MRHLAWLLILVLLPNLALAQDGAADYDMFGVPEQTIAVVRPEHQAEQAKGEAFPDCDDSRLLAEVRQMVAAGEKVLPGENIVNYRARLLAQKNIDHFQKIDIEAFTPQDNVEVANILITDKINLGLKDRDFGLCASDNPVLRRRVYLLMRAHGADTEVRIVNYLPGQVLSFVFKKS